MAREPKLWLVTLGRRRRPFICTVCGKGLFAKREILLNTSGAELFGMGWVNPAADGIICLECGYVHAFLSGYTELWKPQQGYPETRPD